MSTNLQPRVPQGNSTGGQFTHKQLGEAETELGPSTFEDHLSEMLNSPNPGKTLFDTADRLTGLNNQKLRALNYMDGEDARQEVLLYQLQKLRRGTTIRKLTQDTKATNRGVIFRASTPPNRNSEDLRALKVFNETKDKYLQRYNKELSRRGEEILASWIRETWHDRKHRPRVGFHEPVPFESNIEDAYSLGVTDDTDPAREETEAEQSIQDLLHTNENKLSRQQKTEALHQAYTALAQMREQATGRVAPPPNPGTISPAEAKNHKQIIASAGVLTTVEQWYQGETTAETQALFAPWGESLSIDDEQAICDVFAVTGSEDRASAIWQEVLKTSTQ